jgi:hypothetical protein
LTHGFPLLTDDTRSLIRPFLPTAAHKLEPEEVQLITGVDAETKAKGQAEYMEKLKKVKKKKAKEKKVREKNVKEQTVEEGKAHKESKAAGPGETSRGLAKPPKAESPSTWTPWIVATLLIIAEFLLIYRLN